MRNRADQSTLEPLYMEYRRFCAETTGLLQREIAEMYHRLYQRYPDNPDEITAVFVSICDEKSRNAFSAGVKCGVLLALELELDSIVNGG